MSGCHADFIILIPIVCLLQGDYMQIDSGNGAEKSLSDYVIEVVKRYHHEEAGVHVDQIAKELQHKASAGEIKEVVEELVNEGHCYSTTDDYHIKSTEA